MKTYTPEEFKKLYGEVAYNQFKQPEKQQKKQDVFQRSASNIKEAIQNPLSVITQRLSKMSPGPLVSMVDGKAVGNRDSANKLMDTTLGFTGGGPVATSVKNTVKPIGTAIADTVDSLPNPLTGAKDFIGNKLSGITESKIGSQVKTILQESPVEKFDRYVKSGEEALNDPRKLTPLEKAGETAYTTLNIIKEDMGNIGKQKSATLESVGDLKVPEITTPILEKTKKLLQTKLTKEERKLVTSFNDELEALGKSPTARSVDATIDRLYATLFEKGSIGAIPMTTRTKSFINQSIRELNNTLKDGVKNKLGSDDYSILNDAFSRKRTMFDALNKRLGEGGDRGGSLMKRFFSPQDSGTKKLFDYIKKEYGIDLGQDATIAKFVMDTLGDTRAASLLKLPPTTAPGLVEKGIQFVENKLTSPKRVLDKARQMTKPKSLLE